MPWFDEEGWINQYEKKGALWIHDGNPRRPHALTSGKHSNGFFNSELVIPDEELLRKAAFDLVGHFIKVGGEIKKIDRVVGPKTGATKLAEFISGQIGQLRGWSCNWASLAKRGEGRDKCMFFDDPDRKVFSGERVLFCEDVLKTGGSVDLTTVAAANAGGIIFPYVLVLVNRSGLTEASNKKIVALIVRSMPTWDTEAECPLCKQGSEAIGPKGENWSQLTAVY